MKPTRFVPEPRTDGADALVGANDVVAPASGPACGGQRKTPILVKTTVEYSYIV